LTCVQILVTWTHRQNVSGYLQMNINKF
jgi:hypothetical protein